MEVAKKEKLILIFGIRHRWEHQFVEPLRTVFHVEIVYFNPGVGKMGLPEFLRRLNKKIQDEGIGVAVFNVDFFSNIDYLLINSIQIPYKWLLAHDDPTHHVRNSITAIQAQVDGIIVADPVSGLKYRSLGFNTFFLPLEGGVVYSLPDNPEQDRPIDVLFIGRGDLANRREYLQVLEGAGIKVRHEGGEVSRLTYDEMVQLLRQAKLVLNFSLNTVQESDSIEPSVYRYLFEWKGRILEAGLCGALCVSEYAPSLELLFEEEEIPMFENPEQCIALIQRLLSDLKLQQSYRERFVSKCRLYEPEYLVRQFNPAVHPRRRLLRHPNAGRVPHWYHQQSFQSKFRIVSHLSDASHILSELGAIRVPIWFKVWILVRGVSFIARRLFRKIVKV